jgi:hypothetical protein
VGAHTEAVDNYLVSIVSRQCHPDRFSKCGGIFLEQMFYCPACVEWVAETAISKAFGVEAGKLEHRMSRHDPQLAALLSVVAPIAGVLVAAWAGPKLVRFLRS